ncbi:MAG: RluA family pseudouridine synthase [Lachnospiraceae bacterium]|nr:RluA family pseudouridine synthase [Lachnospiraceae bacterium]
MPTQHSLCVTDDNNGVRIDKVLSEEFPDISRSFIQKLIKDEKITVNGKTIKSNYKTAASDMINIEIPDAVEPDILPENIPLDIVYEDEDIIVINKPKGMVVHPAPGHYSGTMVNALMYHCKDNLSGINGVLRPGIVHRIDMDTTGIIVACKNDFSHRSLAEQLKEHSITRKYEAIVYNGFKEKTGTVDAPIARNPIDRKKMAIDRVNGRNAVTHYTVIKNLKGYAHIECQLETGRTHQIRVHMASIKHPLLGDSVYGPAKCPYNLTGQTLHARTLGFIHPRTGKYVEFTSELPDYFNKLLLLLDK